MTQEKDIFQKGVEGVKDVHDGLDQVEVGNLDKKVGTWPQGTWGELDADRPWNVKWSQQVKMELSLTAVLIMGVVVEVAGLLVGNHV